MMTTVAETDMTTVVIVATTVVEVVSAVEYIRALDEVHMFEDRAAYQFTCHERCSVETEAQVRFLEQVRVLFFDQTIWKCAQI